MDSGPSLFAGMLRKLLDGTRYCTRDEWAQICNTTTIEIAQWLNDEKVPPADILDMILDLLRESDNVPAEILQEFDELAVRPLQQISPHFEKLGVYGGHRLEDYLVSHIIKGFLCGLRCLQSKSQEEVLFKAAEHCRGLPSRTRI